MYHETFIDGFYLIGFIGIITSSVKVKILTFADEIILVNTIIMYKPLNNHVQHSMDDEMNNMVAVAMENEYKEPKSWTIITALDRVLELANDSELSEEFWNSCKRPMAYLTKKLGMTKMQVVVVAILVETGEPMSWRGIGKFLRCSRLSIMRYSDEIEGLLKKRWLIRRTARELSGQFEGFALSHGVVTALRHNTPFVPEKIDGLEIQELVDRLEGYLDKYLNSRNCEFEYNEEWIVQLCIANSHLPLCKEVLRFEDDIHIQSLLMLVIYDYAQWAESEEEGLSLSEIDNLYPEEYEAGKMRKKLRDGSHPLIKRGYIEHKCEDGVANTERFILTRKCKEILLEGYIPSKSKCLTSRIPEQDLKNYAVIKKKEMFYNSAEQGQIERLTSLLSQENLPSIQQRLEQEGMRKGFACLFYGAPGTGKTETVLQIARQTGRDIMQIDIAGLRDKYVGESEKNIKSVFRHYRHICKHKEVMPILFFNEADGIFGKRTTTEGNNPSVEKMNNAMQNIILQEMEDLDGILIATTNLTCNLDSAFERRFLFKVEFKKPGTEVKTKLWSSMIGDSITKEDAIRLAKKYDFSGGQIENIARKGTIEYILSGKRATMEELEMFCQSESLDKNQERKAIGFAC